jgi:hypothetical protein
VKVYVKGDGEVTLTQANFVAEGGEGKVYARGDVGYKIYHEPAKAIPLGKIQDLSGITDSDVIVPRDPLYTGRNGQHVGHTFRFVQDTWTLCQLFPRAFREREGLDHKKALELVQALQRGVHAVHRAGILIVDLNEMNFLVSRDFSTPYFIDVDSYQTPRYPATAIMPSIRDPSVHGHDFTEGSDWFSFAIVSFQVFTGIHPFKGKHPKVKGFEERMRAGISVFDANVSLPRTAYPLDVIPPSYRDWYEEVFVRGARCEPPDEQHHVIVLRPVIRRITGTDNFEITEIAEFKEPIRAVFIGGGHVVVYSEDHIFVDGHQVGHWPTSVVVGFTPKHGHPVAALSAKYVGTGLMDLVSREMLGTTLPEGQVMFSGETLYVRSRDKIIEVTFAEAGNKVIASSRVAANVLEHATKLYEGVAIQSLLGEPHVSVFPRPGACYQKTVPELKRHKIVQAKHDSGVLMILAAEGGTYHRFVFRFDDRYETYDVRKVEDVTPTDLNFIVLDSGICVCLNEDEELEVFSSRRGSKSVKTIKDPMLGGDMRLLKQGGRVLFHRDNKLYVMKMKS